MGAINSPDQQNRPQLLPGESGVPMQVADQLQGNLTSAEAARRAAAQAAGEIDLSQVNQLQEALQLREAASIMDIAEGIMENADKDDFKEGGKYALVRSRKVMTNVGPQELREFVPEHYDRWFRDRMVTIADDFSPNKFESFWTSIGIEMGLKRVNFLKMYDLASAWRLEKPKIVNGIYQVK